MPFLMSFALEHEIVTFAWIDNASVQFPLNIYATKGRIQGSAIRSHSLILRVFSCGPGRRRGSSVRPTPWNEMVLSGSLSQAFDDAGCVHRDFFAADGRRRESLFPAGPVDLNLRRRFRGRHDLHGAIL
jgi:hypothetical protein